MKFALYTSFVLVLTFSVAYAHKKKYCESSSSSEECCDCCKPKEQPSTVTEQETTQSTPSAPSGTLILFNFGVFRFHLKGIK